jgi:hypothetical protein
MKRFIKKYKMMIIVLVGLFLLVYALKFADHYPSTMDLKHKPGFFGVTFSTKFSDELELDWKEVYTAMLDELKVKNIRIPVLLG